MSKIFITRFTVKDKINEVQEKIKNLFLKAGFDKIFKKNDLTAVKVHFGEEGNKTYVTSQYIRPFVDEIKKIGAKPFITDTNVLYKSKRDNAVDHLELAHSHGFSYETLGAPIVIGDGIAGRNETKVEINAPINKEVLMATEYVTATSIMVISHATGHLLTGLGATLKNLGMGMSSRKGKLVQHSVSKPLVRGKSCTRCGVCIKNCPENAIILEEGKSAFIVEKTCVGCGECLAVCRYDAIGFKWDTTSEALQKQMAEHAFGITSIKKGKIAYATFLINMTKDCDCLASTTQTISTDIGLIVGTDPVAMDQAALDLTNNNGQNLAEIAFPKIDSTIQINYAQEIGMGEREYELVDG